ncbi:MAG: lipopolysaccharide biosynthesis protein [Paramuribaculum sp.]|nr:lipopolysaccharide biosynthesis protein [Paramuribaculum sp.]
MEENGRKEMKQKVARTIKWTAIDRVITVFMTVVTGIALANIVPKDDFGLIAAILVFQAFAVLFVDNGFATALIQKKTCSREEYSSVLWFNIAMAAAVYIIMFFCAPLIAKVFDNDIRLIPLSRVMFLTFVFNATAIVQTSRLYKMMSVKLVTTVNSLATILSSGIALALAVWGYGAWSLVWQAIILAATKSAGLWIGGGWRPVYKFSFSHIRNFFKVGSGMLGASFLNVLFGKVYGLIIGNRAGILSLSYYGQADKWSTMGVANIVSILTSSFLPALSSYQDQPGEFAAVTAKMNRFGSYVIMFSLGLAIVVATPLFHICFNTKWDGAIILFQLLLLRGVFVSLSSLYNNYIIARGHTKLIVSTEIIRDVVAFIAIAITLPYVTLSTPDQPTKGIAILLWGQVAAAVIAWLYTTFFAAKLSWRHWWIFITDTLPYAATTILALIPAGFLARVMVNEVALLICQCATAIALYLILNHFAGSKIQRDVIDWLFRR